MRCASNGSEGGTGAPSLSLISHSKTGVAPLGEVHLRVALWGWRQMPTSRATCSEVNSASPVSMMTVWSASCSACTTCTIHMSRKHRWQVASCSYRAAVRPGFAREGDEASEGEAGLHPLARVFAVCGRVDHTPVAQGQHAQTLEGERFVAGSVPARLKDENARRWRNAAEAGAPFGKFGGVHQRQECLRTSFDEAIQTRIRFSPLTRNDNRHALQG
jgi:hypothetical protein